jgi:hypothetical protein
VLADFSQIAVARDLAPGVKLLDQTSPTSTRRFAASPGTTPHR